MRRVCRVGSLFRTRKRPSIKRLTFSWSSLVPQTRRSYAIEGKGEELTPSSNVQTSEQKKEVDAFEVPHVTEDTNNLGEIPTRSYTPLSDHTQVLSPPTPSSHPADARYDKYYIPTIFAVILALLVVVVGYTFTKKQPQIYKPFDQKVSPPQTELGINYFKRPGLEETLEQVITPTSFVGYYSVVVGEHGTGKSTLIRQVASRLNGVILFSIPPESNNFVSKLAETVNFTDYEKLEFVKSTIKHVGITHKPIPSGVLGNILDYLEKAAVDYKRRRGVCPTLIIDEANRLVNGDPAALTLLQVTAKDWVAANIINVVFISSEGSILDFFNRSSSNSRARPGPIEIGDLSTKEAKQFLRFQLGKQRQVENSKQESNSQKEDKRQDKKEDKDEDKEFKFEDANTEQNIDCLVETLLGGRLALLSKFVKVYRSEPDKRRAIIVFGRETLQNAKNKFVESGFAGNKEALSCIKNILNSPTRDMSYNSFENKDLLKANIFAYHPSTGTVSLQSKVVELYLSSNVKNCDFLKKVLGKDDWCSELREIHEKRFGWSLERFDENDLIIKDFKR